MGAKLQTNPTLRLAEGDDTPGRLHEISGPITLIGRNPDSNLRLRHDDVSRKHARIIRDGQQYLIEDLDSRNDTFLNSRRLEPNRPVPLSDGDEIRICNFRLVFNTNVVKIKEDDTSSSVILGVKKVAGLAQEKVPALLEIDRVVRGKLELRVLLEETLGCLFRIFDQAERGFVLLEEGQVGGLTPEAVKSRSGDPGPLTISQTVFDYVMREGKAVLSADVSGDSRFRDSPSLATARTIICAPLLDHRGMPIGILQIDAKEGGPTFAQDDLELLVAVAGPVSLAVENARLHKRLLGLRAMEQSFQDAREVHRTFLPSRRPERAGYEFWDYYEPALAVGGDYFDYIGPLEDGQPEDTTTGPLIVGIGDVAGKGMPAALLMAKVSCETRALLGIEPDPVRVVTRLNQRFCDAKHGERFITYALIVLDPQTHRVIVVNAGHMDPIARRASGTIEIIGESAGGLPLAIQQDVVYGAVETTLNPGDVLVLYTDGLSDAMNPEGQCLGPSRLKRALRDGPPRAEPLGNAVLRAVRSFTKGSPRPDDISLICVGRL